MSDISDLLDSLDAAREKATPGPWEIDGEYPNEIYNGQWGDAERLIAETGTQTGNVADAALIVAAVNALPRLVAALRAVEGLAVKYENLSDEPDLAAPARDAFHDAALDLRRTLSAALTPAAVAGDTDTEGKGR